MVCARSAKQRDRAFGVGQNVDSSVEGPVRKPCLLLCVIYAAHVCRYVQHYLSQDSMLAGVILQAPVSPPKAYFYEPTP